MDRELKRKLIADCKPEEPVGPDDARHFDFDAPKLELRGKPWRQRLASVIDLASEPTAQLVTGLRGSGKSTELEQLARALEASNYRVIMVDAGQWLSNERPVSTEDLMLALVLGVHPDLAPDARPDSADAWASDYAERVAQFLRSEVAVEAGPEGVKAKLTTDETLFQKVADELHERDGLRRQIHELLAHAAEASRAAGKELVIIVDGAEQRATGDFLGPEEREEFRNQWFGAFLVEGRDLKPPVHTIYTVPPFMLRRAAELPASFGSELLFLPMVRTYERDGYLHAPGIEAMSAALFRRVPPELFADPSIPRWLCAHCGGYMRDVLRSLTELVYIVDDAPAFTRHHAEQAIARLRQTYLGALALEDKEVLRKLRPSRVFPDTEAARARMDNLLQGLEMFRYQNGAPWYDAHPLVWAELGFDDVPDWDDIEKLP